MTRVALLDYGVGNVGSVRRALERLGAEVIQTSDPDVVAASSRVVLPGVGAFAPARASLAASGLEKGIRTALESGARLLGLCLGFQLLFDASEEFGTTPGLGLLRGRIAPFPPGARVPHVGWNRLETEGATAGPLLERLPGGTYVYFVHSFRPEGVDPADVAAWCDHGGRFVAAARRGNVWGCQFHPEKSSSAGRRILENFLSEAA